MSLKSALVVGPAGHPQTIRAEDVLTAPAIQISGQITSTLSTGTPPLVVSSPTKVDNLNADLLDGNDATWFQQALVSGTNLKTINGESLLGAGNISVAGGSTTTVGTITGYNSGRPSSNALLFKYVSDGNVTLPVNLSGSRATATAPTGGNDEYWDNVVLCMRMDGTNGSTTFTDMKGKTVTANGNASISTAQSKIGGASAYFDGAGDYLSFTNSADFAFGTGDFTVEFYARFTSFYNYINMIGTRIDAGATNAWGIGTQASGQYVCYATGAERLRGSGAGVPGTGSFSTATWHHIAMSRVNNILYGFVDGNMFQSATYNVNLTEQAFRIGAWGAGSETFTGYLDAIRVTKGVGRYTSTFTPQTVDFVSPVEQTTAVCAINKNGSQIGTITFTAGSSVGAISVASQTSLVAGDVLSVTAPTLKDATLADFAFTLRAPGATPSSLTVKDESVDVVTAVSSFNFVGAGVAATTSGNDVTVTVAASQPQIVTSFSGTLTLPFTGTSRRYFNTSRTFTTATLGVSTAATITVTVKKNGTSVGTVSLTGTTYTSTGLSFSVVASDYITIDVSGSTNPADLILTLE